MKKLKLEDLAVTSFLTAPEAPRVRGTVNGQAKLVPQPSLIGPCYPTDPNFDCTLGCSRDTGCPDQCLIVSETGCL